MRPCCEMVGMELEGGWKVIELLKLPKAERQGDPASGGNFCAQYRVKDKRGNVAFLKALDFSAAFQSSNMMEDINKLTSDYLFERDLLSKCKERRMSNVVIPISHGEVEVPVPGPFSKVNYIIFEMANGDIRSRKESGSVEPDRILDCLHGSALGLQQLHRHQIAHQDIKPSNILVFEETSKIGDLGRAADQNRSHRFDSAPFAGDPNYKPFEKYWDLPYAEFADRFSTDLFMLGNLIFFHFMDVSVNALVIKKLRDRRVPFNTMSFGSAVPFLIDAFHESLEDLRGAVSSVSPQTADEVVQLANELCFPDPALRGDPRKKDKIMRYRADRYVSKLANLKVKARVNNVSRV